MDLPGFQDAEFFASAGQSNERFEVVDSWDAAINALISDEWANSTEIAQGDLTAWLSSMHPRRFQGVWNTRIRELRPTVESVVDSILIPAIPIEHGEGVRATLCWDLLLAAIDHDYRDLASRPALPARIRECYQAGHMPCGLSRDGSRIVAY